MSDKLKVKIKQTRHGNYDFYIYADGTAIAVSIDSYATVSDCEKTVKQAFPNIEIQKP